MALKRQLPTFAELPLREGDPPNSAWGLWGPSDKLGALNYLTDELVLRAAKDEVQTGERVGLECATSACGHVHTG